MKRLAIISVFGVVLLLGLMAWNAHQKGRMTLTTRKMRIDPSQTGQDRRSEQKTFSVPPNSSNRIWAALRSSNTTEFIAHLRQVGCPEQTIRDIITSRICRHYRNQLLSQRARLDRSWDYTRNRDSREFSESRLWERGLRNALDQELESLFGVTASQIKASVFGLPEFDYEHEFMSLEKQARVRDINLRYELLIEEARQGMPPWETHPELDTKINELNRHKRSELSQFLSPMELEALMLRESPAARYVRENLPEAKNEEEFRKMVQAVEESQMETPELKSFADRYGLNSQPASSDATNRQARLQARLNDLLGEQRLLQEKQQEMARQVEEDIQEKERREKESRAEFENLARSVGISAEDAKRLFDRLRELPPEVGDKFKEFENSATGSPQEIEQKRRDILKSELERLAVEVVGEKGRYLAEKIVERE